MPHLEDLPIFDARLSATDPRTAAAFSTIPAPTPALVVS